MRDEDLKNLPQSVAGWQVAEMLKTIGIMDYRNVREVLIEPMRIQVTVLATDENGRRYMEYRTEDIETTEPGEEKPRVVEGRSVPVAAEHVISIPFVGSWEKPVADGTTCMAWTARPAKGTGEGAPRRMQCGLAYAHPGPHDYSLDTGRILGDVPQA